MSQEEEEERQEDHVVGGDLSLDWAGLGMMGYRIGLHDTAYHTARCAEQACRIY